MEDPGTIPGRSWDDPGTLGTTRQDTVMSRLGFLLIFGWFRDQFRRVLNTFGTKNVIFSHLFPGYFFWWFWGLNLGVWDRKTKHFARKVLQKSTFAEIGFLMFPGSIFHDFGLPWDQFSWFLLPWSLAWNSMTFQGDSGGTPDPAPLRIDDKWCASGTL